MKTLFDPAAIPDKLDIMVDTQWWAWLAKNSGGSYIKDVRAYLTELGFDRDRHKLRGDAAECLRLTHDHFYFKKLGGRSYKGVG